MTHDDIIRMAREAGIGVTDESLVPVWHLSIKNLEGFAHLVAAAERQRICKQIAQLHDALSMASNPLITPRGSLGEEV